MILHTLAVLAQDVGQGTAGSTIDLVGQFASYGVVGAVLLAILFRFRLMPTYVHDDAIAAATAERTRLETEMARLIAERDNAIEALAAANLYLRTEVVPALTRVNEALNEARTTSDARRRRAGT